MMATYFSHVYLKPSMIFSGNKLRHHLFVLHMEKGEKISESPQAFGDYFIISPYVRLHFTRFLAYPNTGLNRTTYNETTDELNFIFPLKTLPNEEMKLFIPINTLIEHESVV